MIKTAVGYLAVAAALMAWSPAIAQQESSTTETTQTVSSPPAAPVVLDSYMKPVVTRTKETTDKEGNVSKDTAPLIMERHEQVAIPGQETHVTTVKEENRSATVGPKTMTVVHHTPVHHTHVAYRPRPVHHGAYKPAKQHLAVTTRSAKTENVSRTVISEQTIQTPTTVIERKDPALDRE